MGKAKKERRLQLLSVLLRKLQADGKFDSEDMFIITVLMAEWKITPEEVCKLSSQFDLRAAFGQTVADAGQA